MEAEIADAPIAVLAALAEPMRWRVLTLLSDRARSASALSETLPISRTAVLKHLHALEHNNLIKRERVGRQVQFSVCPEQLAMTARWMSQVANAWDTRLAALQRLAAES